MTRIEAEVRRVRRLLDTGQVSGALAAARALHAEVPENRDVLWVIAVCQRKLGQIPAALETLRRFENIHPDYSLLFQERGHCNFALGDAAGAIEAYLRAVNKNPALPASWKALEAVFRTAGQFADADTAAQHVAHLANLPLPVVSATSLFADGEIHAAEAMVRQFLQTHRDNVEGMRLLAKIGVERDVLDDAEFLLESVLVFAPDYHLARYEYADVLLRRHRHAQALEQVRALLKVDSENRTYRTIFANVCVGLGNHEEALQIFRELSAQTPQAEDLHLSIGHALKTLGRQTEAIESYRQAAKARPSFGDAYWSLANLKTYRFTDEEIGRMRIQETVETQEPIDRYHLCFALAKALEDRREYAESFQYYERGNALKKAENRYNAAEIERQLMLQADVCTREFFSARKDFGCDRTDPIFVVGLPRAGSTLIEQILASHSKVEGTMELPDIPRLVQKLRGREPHESNPRYPQVLTELNGAQLRRFGEKYIADTQVYRSGKAFFVDKMPNNFRHIGLIHLILPNARIIDARREAMACCFSNFKQLFASGQEFTYSMDDIGRYYRSYVELMGHWNKVLPGAILRIQHEEVVENLEDSVRRILDFCGLEFEPQCVEFYKTERSVRTASSEQVRRPIFKEGIAQWRNYAPWLGPLQAALGAPNEQQQLARSASLAEVATQ